MCGKHKSNACRGCYWLSLAMTMMRSNARSNWSSSFLFIEWGFHVNRVLCRHCAEVQLNFSEFTAERCCVGGTLDSIDIPHKLAYLKHIRYVMCSWPPTSLFRSPTRSGLRQETSLLHTQFFGFSPFVGKPYKKSLNFSRVFCRKNFLVQWKFLVRLRWRWLQNSDIWC